MDSEPELDKDSDHKPAAGPDGPRVLEVLEVLEARSVTQEKVLVMLHIQTSLASGHRKPVEL